MSRLPKGGSHSSHVMKIFQEGGSDKKVKGHVVQAWERRREKKTKRKLAQGCFLKKKSRESSEYKSETLTSALHICSET